MDRGYISNGLRWRAQQVATEELGPRTELEVQRAQAREVQQERFTSIDRELERRVQHDRVQLVDVSRRSDRVDEATLVARLERLESMGLAQHVSSREWTLRSDWERTLRELGIRGDIIKQMHAALSGDPSRYQIVGQGQPIPDGYAGHEDKPLLARVTAKGLADELKGDFFVVLEGANGAAYHVWSWTSAPPMNCVSATSYSSRQSPNPPFGRWTVTLRNWRRGAEVPSGSIKIRRPKPQGAWLAGLASCGALGSSRPRAPVIGALRPTC